jgi:hypothetical protein
MIKSFNSVSYKEWLGQLDTTNSRVLKYWLYSASASTSLCISQVVLVDSVLILFMSVAPLEYRATLRWNPELT